MEPIQRLPKYQLLVSELIKKLEGQLNEDDGKFIMASCCRAEKDLKRLLDRVNDSMSIHEIIGFKVKLHLSLFLRSS